ncbi:MATE family efflux transporter [Pseudalkalibacillus caeni]|uniref:Probable multidrug resistance protein NorM n=1 Tax=Exobacillus caeni TaxID=2574798 RepID=A0A5R9EZD2_9BACL|nr:MATE family efflux transporter [Pseudalkalibacillus caeni]TLS35460.1 MATE family efflux transporter [Pseudalkalibacillus caeni]
MYQTNSIGKKLQLFVAILYPILITQLGLFAMSFFDTLMSGRAGAFDLAGVAIGSSLWVPIFTGLNGILLAITPIVAQLNGGGEKEKVPFSVIQGIYLSVFLSIIIIISGFFLIDPILQAMDLKQEVQLIAKNYLVGLSFGVIPLFIYTVLRCFIDALGKTRVTMIVTLMSLPLNVGFNYLLIFGKLGLPRLGGAGAGYASAITYWFIMFISLYVVARKRPFSTFKIFKTFYRISLSAWKEQLKIGIPIGFAIFFEVSIFAAVTLFMSEFSTVTIAAHQAAINFASLVYMLPLSISMALTVVVGFEAGARRMDDAAHYSYIGIGVALILSVICGLGLYFYNEPIAGLYTKDMEVLKLAAHFLLYAIFFQLSDAIAAPIQGALRGYKDVNVTLIMALVSYWVVGLPIGYMLANYTHLGPFGYWVGLITGLAMGAVTLFSRLLIIQKRQKEKYKDAKAK